MFVKKGELKMGFFSWKTSDTDRSISNLYSSRGTFPVYVLIPKEFGGGHLVEKRYEGYGEFGGKDIFNLVAEWNAPEECKWKTDEWIRLKGIELYHGNDKKNDLKYPIKITEYKMNYEDALPSERCEYQGYFY